MLVSGRCLDEGLAWRVNRSERHVLNLPYVIPLRGIVQLLLVVHGAACDRLVIVNVLWLQ